MGALRSFLQNLHFRRNAIWMIPLLLFFTYPLWSIPVGKFLTPRGDFAKHATPRTERKFNLQKVKITLNRKGVKTAFILASEARTKTADTLAMEDVIADLYDKEGNITKIRAKQGEYNTKNEQLVLKKDVVVHKTVDHQVLYSQILHFDNIKQMVHCPGTTQIVAKGAILNGGSFDYDIKNATYNLGKPVRCEITDFESNN